jgi:lipopolysaccharide transport protein LptA
LSISGIAVLLLAYRFGQEDRGESRDETVDAKSGRAGAVSASEGFDYTLWSDRRRIFRLRADYSQQERDNTASMEEVVLDVYRQAEDGAPQGGNATEDNYTVTSRRARVNQDTWAARLEGDVVVTGWENVELEARVLELRDGGQVLESVGAVAFRYPPNLVGRATKMRLDRRTGTIHLEGGVHVKSVEGAEVPLRLDCQRLTYRSSEGLLRALDDVSFRFGNRHLKTRSLTVFLDEDRRSLKHLVARWDVEASLQPEDPIGGGSRLELWGEHLELVPDEERPEARRIQLRGGDQRAVLKTVESDGLARRISGQVLEGLVLDGVLQLVEGYGEPLILSEFLDTPDPFRLRQACARSLVARFLPDGELAQIQLEQEVELSDQDTYLSGGRRAHLDLASGKLDIEGPAVELLSDRGDLTAPRFDYRRETGFIRATGGVRGTLSTGSTASLAAAPLSGGEGPLRVEADEAFFTGEPRTFSFRGQVRAWRADNLLLAEQLRGDEESEQLAASGEVKTVWKQMPPSGGAGDSGNSIEVTAQNLTWDRAQGQVIYHGEVEIKQGKQTLQCGQMTVEFADPGDGGGAEAERMICRDDVLLVDSLGGQRVEGDLAIYSLAEEKVEIFGESVKLLGSQKSSLTGRYLVYNLVDGKMQLRRRPPGEDRLRGGNGIGEGR